MRWAGNPLPSLALRVGAAPRDATAKHLITFPVTHESKYIIFDANESYLRRHESPESSVTRELAMIHLAVSPRRHEFTNH